MNNIKRNKSKVWRKCYGKPFIQRKAISKFTIASISAVGNSNLKLIQSCVTGDLGGKKVAIANCVLDTAKAITKVMTEANKGFAR